MLLLGLYYCMRIEVNFVQNRLMLNRFLSQKIRLFESPCAASGLGFDYVRMKLVCKYYSAELLRLGLNCFLIPRAHSAQDDSGSIAQTACAIKRKYRLNRSHCKVGALLHRLSRIGAR